MLLGKIRNLRSLLMLMLSLAAAAGLSAQAARQAGAAGVSAEKREKIETAAQKFISATSAPGVSVAVVLDGKTAYLQGFGEADLEHYVPAHPQTLYRLASVSKTITATAIMQLVEHGKLDLDAEVQSYCPAFPKKEWPITTRELLGHLGGIRHYGGKGDVPDDSARHFSSMEESLTIFDKDALVAKPGTEFHYTTYGYTLLGCVLEGAAHEKYIDYVNANIFVPAGMRVTLVDDNFSIIPHRTRFYHKDEAGAVKNAGVLDSSYKIPGGGFISSAEDMARYEEAWLADKFVKRATRDLMWTSQKTTDGKETGYGYGWGVSNKFGVHLVSHSGGQQGTSTNIVLVPERNAAVAVLANMDNVGASELSNEILKIVLDLKEEQKAK